MQSIDRQTPAPSQRRDFFELSISFGMILAVVWTPRPWQRYLWILAAAFVVVIALRSSDTLKSMGLRAANLIRSSWVVGAALLVAAAAVGLAARMHTLRWPGGPLQFLHAYAAYILWAFVQQFMLLCIFLSRLLRLLPNSNSAALLAAFIFAVAHLPNPILVPITLVFGLAGCLVFLHYRTIISVALAHAILGVCIAITIPGPVDHNMRVGISYLNYHQRLHPLSQPRPAYPSAQP